MLMDFYFFAENIGKNLINKYGQKLLKNTKKMAADAFKTAFSQLKKH